ncbi:MAG: type IV pilus modification PilV family protein [Phycisphaerales bacterium]
MNIRLLKFVKVGRAFTLVEVLLGIIILAIGLLGLAAVFPLVVKQQREAQDTVVGVSAAKAAESYLTQQHGYFDATLNDYVGLNAPSGKSGWGALSWAMYQTAWANKVDDFGLIRWSRVFDDSNQYKTAISGSGAEQAAGNIPGALYFPRYQSNVIVPNQGLSIKPYDRLLPMPTTTTTTNPLFVWDVVPMLATPIDTTALITTQTALPLRVAVFVRRIDPGIRLPNDPNTKLIMPLAEAIANNVVLPLGVDADGLPTLNGKGTYPRFFYPKVAKAYRRFGSDSGPFNVIEFTQATGYGSPIPARQVGQQLLDNEGNIYTVTALPDETGTDVPYQNVLDRCVVISPGLPTGYLNSTTSKNENQSAVRGGRTLELLCSPHIPANVSTFLVRP